MEDQQIIQLYFERSEQAVAETKQKYGPYCHSLAYAILNNDADAEEAVNDTLLRVWNSIPPQRPTVLKLFLAKITRNLAFNVYRNRNAQKRGGGEVELALEELKDCVPAPETAHDALEGKELARVIQKFLENQSDRDRTAFIRRYFCAEEAGSIARCLGLTEANVRQILSRTRKKLREYLTKEGYAI